MKSELTDRTVRVECRPEPDSGDSRILIGKVLAENSLYLLVKGRLFRRRAVAGHAAEIRGEPPALQAVPWHRIRRIVLIEDKANFRAALRGELAADPTVLDSEPAGPVPAECYHG